MRKVVIAAAVAAVLGSSGFAGASTDRYDDTQSHPLRVAAYLLHPVGYTLEWLVFRPFHALVSQEDLEPVTGHTKHHEHVIGGTAGRPSSSRR